MSPHAIFDWTGQWPWVALFLLGAFHGLNPAMGWLFAVSLGLQQKRRAAVLEALPPILLGHVVSVALVVVLLEAFRTMLPPVGTRVAASLILLSFGGLRFWRSSHPRWVGMQVGFRDLTLWSFLMASAHGAGLMLMPFVLALPGVLPAHLASHEAMMGMQVAARGPVPGWLLPVGIHTVGYALAMGMAAAIVYEKLGLTILRRAWVNLDMVWAAALVGTGVVSLFI